MSSSTHFCVTCGADNSTYATVCQTCGRSLQASLPTGLLPPNYLLKGRYRLLGKLGEGAFGAVYKALDMQFNRPVAIKVMSQNGPHMQMQEAIDAFQREARLLAALQHPSLPIIYEHFCDAERWYFVMSFIEGETLEEYLNKAKGGRLVTDEVLNIGIQICEVLDYLHTRNPQIVFRDLKLSNIMRTPDGRIYLIDFGIARHFKPGQSKDTVAFGSAGYAAPEQHGRAQTTPRTDIYSLGAVLHQLVTGNDPSQTPFRFVLPRLYDQSIPAGLETLIMQMLDMDASKRPSSMASVKQALQGFAGQANMQPSPVTSAHRGDFKTTATRKVGTTNMNNWPNETSQPSMPIPPYPISQIEQHPAIGHPPQWPPQPSSPPRKSNRRYQIVIAILVLLLIGAGILEVRQLEKPGPSPQPTTPVVSGTAGQPTVISGSTPTSTTSSPNSTSTTSTSNDIHENLTIPCTRCNYYYKIELVLNRPLAE